MYFYLQQDNSWQAAWGSMQLIQELQDAWLETVYYTQDQAFSRLADYLPSILDDFQEYGLENPLPPTLYVLFSNEEQYQVMRSILVRYSGVISNIDDITQWSSYQEQEQRVQTTINVMNLIHQWGVLLVGWIIIVIVWFLRYILHALLIAFKEQIVLEKLLWAYNRQIALPFVIYGLLIVIVGYLVFLGWAYASLARIDTYTYMLFQQSFRSLALPAQGVWTLLLQEFIVLAGLTALSSSAIVQVLLRRQ